VGMVRIMLTLAAFVLLGLAPADNAAAARHCGLTERIQGVRYDVREVRGTASCRVVKRVVTSFLRHGTVSRPWVCARGHGSPSIAASWARGERVLVRVYAPT